MQEAQDKRPADPNGPGFVERRKMARYLSRLDVWAVALGVMVGWGAFVMPGTTFLPIAGPAGTVLALAISTVLILVIGRNYGYLMARRPAKGGIYSYTREAFGRDHAFICSWFLSLSYLTIVFLNATALFIVTRTMFGSFWQFGFHYQVLGYDVYMGEIALSAALLVITALLFVFGKPFLQHLQTVLGVVLFAGVLLIAVATLPHFDPALLGEFSPGTDFAGSLGGIALIVLLAPWAFVGFDVVSLESAHFTFAPKKSWQVIAIAILCAGLCYIALVLVSVSFVPDQYGTWQAYIADLDNLSGVEGAPTFFAAESALGQVGLALITITALAAIFTGVLGASRGVIRMLSTMAEDQILSEEFKGTAFCAIFVVAISIFISFLGRNALEWFVELTSFGAIVGYGYASASAHRLARREGNRTVRVTGAIGTAVAVAFAVVQLVSQVGSLETMGAPSFLLLALWCLVGFVFYWRTARQTGLTEFDGVTLSSVVLFCLLFYSALMWFVKTVAAAPMDDQLMSVVAGSAVVLALIVGLGLAVMLYVQSLLRRYFQDLERDKIRAEESSNAKTQFLFNMSHDIRTPMNAIIGYTYLAKQEDGMSDKVRDYLDKIDTSGNHLLTIVDDILEMSQIESGNATFDLVETDLREMLDEVENLFAVQMEKKGIEFVVDGSRIADRVVLCDRSHFVRAIQNLVSNAWKFTPEGGSILLTLEQIGVAVDGRADYELRVKDTGIGMSPEFVAKVFDVFERERTSTVSGIQGTGLGMAITKRIVESMGGTIDVDTEQGRGTEFTVRVSFALSEKAHGEQAREADEGVAVETGGELVSAAPDFTALRVLVVDDSEVNREILTMLLSGHGIKVEKACNGHEAVDAIAASQAGYYDAVLMDIQMPVMDGYEAAERIRQLDDRRLASVPIIAVTANAFGEDARKAAEMGMDGHIAKPIDPDTMMATLWRVLADVPESAS